MTKSNDKIDAIQAKKIQRTFYEQFGEEAMLMAARDIMENPSEELTTLEAESADAASMVAGEYLMDIGKTDFAIMTDEERTTFIHKLITAYRMEVRKAVRAQPPF